MFWDRSNKAGLDPDNVAGFQAEDADMGQYKNFIKLALFSIHDNDFTEINLPWESNLNTQRPDIIYYDTF